MMIIAIIVVIIIIIMLETMIIGISILIQRLIFILM